MAQDLDQYKKEVLIAAQQVTQATVGIMKQSQDILQEFAKSLEDTYRKLDKLNKDASVKADAPRPGGRKI